MHVDDAPGIQGGEILREDAQESGQHDQVGPVLLQRLNQFAFEGLLAAAAFLVDLQALDPGLDRALHGVGAEPVAHDQRDLSVRNLSPGFGIQDRLEVRSAAGDQYSDSGFLAHASLFPIR